MARDLNYDITGKSLNDFLDISSDELKKMTPSSMKKLGARLVTLSNHRIKRLADKDIDARDLTKWAPNGKFSVKGLNITDLQKEIRDMKNFLSVKTTNIGSYKKREKQVKEFSGFEDVEEQNIFYDAFSEFERNNSEFFKEFKYEIKEIITKEIKNKKTLNKADILKKAVNIGRDKSKELEKEDDHINISSFNFR